MVVASVVRLPSCGGRTATEMDTLLPFPILQFLDDNGVPLAGGSVASYIPNTMTKKTTYEDAGGITANANPTILDSAGRGTFYGNGDYDFVVKDNLGNTIYTGPTSAPLPADAISDAMLPVVGAASTATALQLLGIPAYIAGVVATIELLPGPTGPAGPTGPVGPIGPSGASLGESLNIQEFQGSGTWVNPGLGSIVNIQIWGSGGAGSTTGLPGQDGGGGGGGYVCVTCALSTLPGTVPVVIDTGGVISPGGPGGNAGTSAFGPYVQQVGGSGGTDQANQFGTQQGVSGISGYTSIIRIDLIAVLGGSAETSDHPITRDRFGNVYGGPAFAGGTGFNTQGIPGIISGFGGSGGQFGQNGSSPGGGGGGGSAAGGNGGAGLCIVTVY